MLFVKEKLQKIIDLINKVNRLNAELNNNEYIDEDYIFKRKNSEIENDLTQAKEDLNSKLEKLVKSIEGKDDIISIIIAHCLLGDIIINDKLGIHWNNGAIPRYLTREQINICYEIRENEREKVYKIERVRSDNAKLQEFIKFVNDYNEYHKTNIQITGFENRPETYD
jgi:hypothetical protein